MNKNNGDNNVGSLLKMLPKMEQHLQQQQQAEGNAGGAEEENDVNDNMMEDDSRFEVPTESPAALPNNAVDALNLAPSGATNASNYGDGLSDMAVEDRIK